MNNIEEAYKYAVDVLERNDALWRLMPEDRIESRTSWEEMDTIATEFYYALVCIKDCLKRKEV